MLSEVVIILLSIYNFKAHLTPLYPMYITCINRVHKTMSLCEILRNSFFVNNMTVKIFFFSHGEA
jgi:hypothetical protein